MELFVHRPHVATHRINADLHAVGDFLVSVTVGELVEATGFTTGNVSKHLRLLHSAGFVRRRKEGLFVFYALAGDDVFRLCDIMCGQIEAGAQSRLKLLGKR